MFKFRGLKNRSACALRSLVFWLPWLIFPECGGQIIQKGRYNAPLLGRIAGAKGKGDRVLVHVAALRIAQKAANEGFDANPRARSRSTASE
jgi:hypothetical protein